jgi:hypothetical protein
MLARRTVKLKILDEFGAGGGGGRLKRVSAGGQRCIGFDCCK